MNPYYQLVSEFARLLNDAKSFPLGQFEPAHRPQVAANAPKALFFAPHPDDECISGGVALRLLREAGMNVINVAVTQGSKRERQGERFQELKNACAYLGFGVQSTGPGGLEKINPKTRREDPAHWSGCVDVITGILEAHRPKVVICPHELDWNSTHIGTHFLVLDALKRMPASFEPYVIETEFWGQMADPNLMLEISPTDLADMITATSFHVGEVKRNPYHLSLTGWMMDNVRRGGELVGGQGGSAPDFSFAALYRFRQWKQGILNRLYVGGRHVPRSLNIGGLFPPESGH
jgi:LmbE family N-acetylglucosaminyl deacetylase